MITTSVINDDAFEVEFMTCVVDKAKNLVIKECDSHFCEFAGIHPSKIAQGKLDLYDVLLPRDREEITRQLCKKNSPYVYFNLYIKNKAGDEVYVHAVGENEASSTLCHITFADVSRSAEKTQKYRAKAKEMNHLIDLVASGVALFKVHQDMHFSALYLNEACCKILGTTKEKYRLIEARIDEFIHPEDRSTVFQAIGNCMATKKPINLEVRIMAHKDEYFWCKMDSAIQRYDNDGCPIFHAVFTDISNVKKGEEEADRHSDMLVQIFKNLPDALFYTSLENPFELQVVSSDFMKLIGYTRTEFFEALNGDLRKIIVSSDIARVEAEFSQISPKNKELAVDYTIKTKGGEKIAVTDKRKVVFSDNEEAHTIGILGKTNNLI